MASFFGEFLNQLDERFSSDARGMSMTDWIEANTTLRNKPFSTKGYEFQRAICDDMSPSLDCMKASQCGLTEVELRKMLGFLRRHHQTTGIFTLPTEDMYKKTSQTRLQPILDKDKVFRPLSGKGVKNVSTIQIGHSFLLMQAAIEQAATSTPADAVFNDEIDLSDQDSLDLFNSRLQNSNWQISQGFSTPTFFQFGIHGRFLGTDQHHYMVRCKSCNRRQHPEFTRDWIEIPGLSDKIESLTDISPTDVEDIDLTLAYVKCHHCQSQLDMIDPSLREWVPKFPSRKDRRGYFVSPFATARLTPGYIVNRLVTTKLRNRPLRRFHNTVLGVPFTDGTNRLTPELIEACFGPSGEKFSRDRDIPCSIGIDVGEICHIVLGARGVAFCFRTCHVDKLIDVLTELDKTFRIVAGCIDRFPYEPTADQVFKWSKSRILPVEYRGTAEMNLVKDAFGVVSHGQVNRTKFIDRVAGAVRQRTITFIEYGIYKNIISDHLQDMVREEDDPEKAATAVEKEAKWKKLTGNDHFFHALAMMMGSFPFQRLVTDRDDSEQRETITSQIVQIGGAKPLTQQKRLPLGRPAMAEGPLG